MLGLAEPVLQKDEVRMAGYVWYGRNGDGGRWAYSGVGVW